MAIEQHLEVYMHERAMWDIANQNPSDFSHCRASAGPQRRELVMGYKEF